MERREVRAPGTKIATRLEVRRRRPGHPLAGPDELALDVRGNDGMPAAGAAVRRRPTGAATADRAGVTGIA